MKCKGRSVGICVKRLDFFFIAVACGFVVWANPPQADGFDANDFASEVVSYYNNN